MSDDRRMTKEEFCQRFKTHMIKTVGEKDCNGVSVSDYADDIAPTYWIDESMRDSSPEECADCDLSYWEPEP